MKNIFQPNDEVDLLLPLAKMERICQFGKKGKELLVFITACIEYVLFDILDIACHITLEKSINDLTVPNIREAIDSYEGLKLLIPERIKKSKLVGINFNSAYRNILKKLQCKILMTPPATNFLNQIVHHIITMIFAKPFYNVEELKKRISNLLPDAKHFTQQMIIAGEEVLETYRDYMLELTIGDDEMEIVIPVKEDQKSAPIKLNSEQL